MAAQHRSRPPRLIGVIHLLPLPGAPAWQGSMERVCQAAAADARAYAEGGFDAVIVENYGDTPFGRSRVGAETTAAMALAAQAVASAAPDLPLGFNVLRNDPLTALGLCAACRGGFIRVNVHTGAMLTDQGLIEGDAFETVRRRRALCPDALILADVMVKHASPLGSTTLRQAARDTFLRGHADALIVSGAGTGELTDLAHLEEVRLACPDAPLVVGSGARAEDASQLLQIADSLIVGTSLKADSSPGSPVDVAKVRAFREAADGAG